MSCIVEGSALGRAIEGSAASVVPRKSFSYCKLPQQRQLLKLTVLKLDGTCFDVQVARTASVGELKQAVEDVFNQSPKEDHRKISWSHVWGHFCLCYEGYKLINDKEFLRDFGIRDGDQVVLRKLEICGISWLETDEHEKDVVNLLSIEQR
ncbi:U11/U12 small nuclear ribonucleoprotein 25 kDa protein-like isoform X2 [Nymphaea colorata]|uniref:U11/U12 small nuclear ribonucleoprotein 25 kDa protein-like isoform X2 n=1 Tax=Nymphaea colorata TaxID=210225 RepID=UPI00129EF64A|nr:U11/U12 small nuclear ribonucleoprotein 25 kDa protein-like isoform X2 [Nymphaea colorata]